MPKYVKNSVESTNAIGKAYSISPTAEGAHLLYKAFEPFIEKYVSLLSPRQPGQYQVFKFSSETKGFLRLFASKGDFSSNPSNTYHMVAQRLPNMAIQSLLDQDDLRQTLIMIFLATAQKFKPEIGGFTGYIKYHFKFAVKSWIFSSHGDAINYQPLYAEPGEESFFGYDVDYEEGKIRIHNGHDLVGNMIVDRYIDLPTLTPSLISNPVPPFDTMWTKQERAIIVKVYVEQKSFCATANELGYSNATTVRDMHNTALEKFRAFASKGSK